MRWTRRLAYWLRFRSREKDLREELTLHRELLANELERRGLTPNDAAWTARSTMGNETYMREEARGVWLSPTLDALLQDWRYAWRGLRRSPSFALVAIVSLALGIGANTAIFGLIHALLLARLPIPRAAELVELRRDLGAKGTDDRFSRDEFDALVAGPLPLTMFASSSGTLEIDGVTINTSLDAVNGRYFNLLGIRPQRGRLLSARDDADAAPIVVVTDRFWRRRMNADPSALGRIVKIDGQPFTVVGIAPAGFASLRFPALAELIVPYRAAIALGVIGPNDPRRIGVTIVGRRRGSQSIDGARIDLAALWNRCCADGQLVAAPRGQRSVSSQLALVDVSRGVPHPKLDLRGQYGRILFALMAGVGILLLAACANVANLLLARNSARAGELALRLALGGSRARLVMQLAIESLQLSLGGALLGVAFAYWGTTVLVRVGIGDLADLFSTSHAPNGSVIAFAAIVSVVSGLIFGVVPSVRVMRGDLVTPLKQGGRRTRTRHGALDRGLVALQAALALLLVTGATLLVQTLQNLQRTDLGFDPRERLALAVETRHTAYAREGMTARMADEMLRRVRAIPGVESAAFGTLVPVYGGRSVSDNVSVRGQSGASDVDTWFTAISPGYFTALGISLLAGRDVGPPVLGPAPRLRDVVVNDRFVRRFFPQRDPVGQLFEDSDAGDTLVTENRIVGVVASAKFTDLRAAAEPMYFVPLSDERWPFLELVVRPSASASSVGPAMSRAIAAVAPGIAQGDPSLLSSSIDDALSRERVSAGLAMLFGIIAMSLVAVGLYGVMLYQVTERTTEIGIRIALGARSGSVVGLVLRQSLGVVGAGITAGIPLSMLAGRAVATQLYGVTAFSVSALVVATTSLIVVAIVATLVPVRRAVSVDPLTALRAD
ncbi:MAG TPA: ABC transporter permease [Gemmatimonadaceae bacterium]